MAYVALGLAFLPSYFVDVNKLLPAPMSMLLAATGVSSLVFSIALPTLSDIIGRRTVLLMACSTSVLGPLAALCYHGPLRHLAAMLFFGWSMAGTGSFFMGIIPSESVDRDILPRVLGCVISLGVLAGGLFAPAIAGWCADWWGAGAPLMIQAACAGLGTLAALMLKETAPRLTGKCAC